MKEHTRSLHTEAERSGVIRDLLTGAITREAYLLYLRNLAVVYESLEQALNSPDAQFSIESAVYRSDALQSDLCALAGEQWRTDIAVLKSAEKYKQRIEALYDSPELIAHIYVRYLGDLNGGQVLAKLLVNRVNLKTNQLTFYKFDQSRSMADYREAMRDMINVFGSRYSGIDQEHTAIVAEAAEAFRYNIALSLEVASE